MYIGIFVFDFYSTISCHTIYMKKNSLTVKFLPSRFRNNYCTKQCSEIKVNKTEAMRSKGNGKIQVFVIFP